MCNEETCLSIVSLQNFLKMSSFIVLSLNIILCEYFTITRDISNEYLRKLINSNSN